MRFILHEYKNLIKLEQKKDLHAGRQGTLKLLINNNFSSSEELLLFLIEFCDQVAKLFAGKAVIEEEQTN
jgi:hypothetical protein